jgi:hypothetical protein
MPRRCRGGPHAHLLYHGAPSAVLSGWRRLHGRPARIVHLIARATAGPDLVTACSPGRQPCPKRGDPCSLGSSRTVSAPGRWAFVTIGAPLLVQAFCVRLWFPLAPAVAAGTSMRSTYRWLELTFPVELVR